jgi:hypothetical protein
MQPSEALSASAQVAVTLAGFAGVVVAFRSGAVHEWSAVDKFRLLFLLNNSALPFLMSILAMVLSTTTLNEQTIWRLCSLVAFVVTAASGQLLGRSFRATVAHFLSWLAAIVAVLLIIAYFRVRRSSLKSQTVE